MDQAPAKRKAPSTPHAPTHSGTATTKRSAEPRPARTPHARSSSRPKRTVEPVATTPVVVTPPAPVPVREVSMAETEFMQAMQAYKVQSGRMFPTWSEVLEVLKGLGYEKPAETVTFATSSEPLATPHARIA